MSNQPKVIGLGGVFFRSKNKKQLYDWYREVLGIDSQDWGKQFNLADNHHKDASISWSIFDDSTPYFSPSTKDFMINFVVSDVDGFEKVLREKNIEILGKESSEFGKFMWICDPDGNKLELWEPAEEE